MTQSNARLLEPVYESWGKGDFTPQFEVYADDMEWGFSDEFIESGMLSEIGRKSPRLRAWLKDWEDWRCEAEHYVEAGDKVVVLARYSGRGKGSGAPVERDGAHVWTMRDGKAVRLEVFPTRESALEATGIDPANSPPASARSPRRTPPSSAPR